MDRRAEAANDARVGGDEESGDRGGEGIGAVAEAEKERDEGDKVEGGESAGAEELIDGRLGQEREASPKSGSVRSLKSPAL